MNLSSADLISLTNYDTAGDGNCGYRAVAIGLVVAASGLSENAWAQFEQHLKSLWRDMQQHDYLLQCKSPSQGHVKMGFDALMVCNVFSITCHVLLLDGMYSLSCFIVQSSAYSENFSVRLDAAVNQRHSQYREGLSVIHMFCTQKMLMAVFYIMICVMQA